MTDRSCRDDEAKFGPFANEFYGSDKAVCSHKRIDLCPQRLRKQNGNGLRIRSPTEEKVHWHNSTL